MNQIEAYEKALLALAIIKLEKAFLDKLIEAFGPVPASSLPKNEVHRIFNEALAENGATPSNIIPFKRRE